MTDGMAWHGTGQAGHLRDMNGKKGTGQGNARQQDWVVRPEVFIVGKRVPGVKQQAMQSVLAAAAVRTTT